MPLLQVTFTASVAVLAVQPAVQEHLLVRGGAHRVRVERHHQVALQCRRVRERGDQAVEGRVVTAQRLALERAAGVVGRDEVELGVAPALNDLLDLVVERLGDPLGHRRLLRAEREVRRGDGVCVVVGVHLDARQPLCHRRLGRRVQEQLREHLDPQRGHRTRRVRQ